MLCGVDGISSVNGPEGFYAGGMANTLIYMKYIYSVVVVLVFHLFRLWRPEHGKRLLVEYELWIGKEKFNV